MNNDTFNAHGGFSPVGNIFFLMVEKRVKTFDWNIGGFFDNEVTIMTPMERAKIQQLRQQGYGYVKIAQELRLPKNTVKSFCYRNPVEGIETPNVCKQCGKSIAQNPKRRERKFCSIACRIKWWNRHHSELQHRKLTKCVHCGKSFYGRPGRKYCSHQCYIAERFGGNHVTETV